MTARYRFLAAAILLAVAAPARAADPPLPAELDLVPRDADVVASVRVAKLWAGDLFQSYREFVGPNTEGLADMFGCRPDDLDRLTAVVTGDDAFGIVTTIKPTNRKKVLAAFAPRGAERKIGTTTCYRDEEKWVTVAFVDTHTALIGRSHVVELHLARGHPKDGPHAETLKLAAKHDLVFGANNGETGWKGLSKALPDAFSKVSPLLKATYGVVTLDARPADPKKGDVSKLELRGAFRYASKKDAEAATRAVGDFRAIAHKEIERLKNGWAEDGVPVSDYFDGGLRDAAKALGGADVGRADTPPANDRELLLAATVRGAKDVGTFAIALALEHAIVNVYSDGGAHKPDANLQKLANALLAYEKEHGRLPPPAIYAKDGKTPLLSWRVLVLPYLGDEAKKLHARFKLDEPWDSDHNIRLVAQMPKVFAPTAEIGSSSATTHFQLFTGPGTLFPGPKGRPLAEATDGAANTILLAQATRAVPWSKPQDLEYAAKKPVPVLGVSGLSLLGPHAQVAFADGTVRVLRAPVRTAKPPNHYPSNGEIEGWADDFDEAALRGLITPAGGEKVEPEGGFSIPAKAVPADPVPGLPIPAPGLPGPTPAPPAKPRG